MDKIIPLIALLLIGAIIFIMMQRRPLQRGLNDNVFISTGRPALAVEVKAPLSVTHAGVVDIMPEVDSGQASAKLWYALYADTANHITSPAQLLVILSETGDQWIWALDTTSGQHEVHQKAVTFDGQQGRAATFVLSATKDPWNTVMNTPEQDFLVRRFTFLPHRRLTKLILEYREPLPQTTIPIFEDAALLAAFEKRAQASFILHMSPKGTPPTIKTLGYAPTTLERRAISRFMGKVDRSRGKK